MSTDGNAYGPAVVEAIDVHHHYGEGPQRVDVLFDINMQVREGELLIVTGPSGSGKTTLLTILGTMRRPSEGQLRLLNTNVGDLTNAELDRLRNRVRFLFQKRNLLSSLTALQNVVAGVSTTALTHPRWDETRARHLLSLLGLADKADSWPDELSGGQQQRVAIARVMIGLPDLIIADEPTSALDRVAGRLVVDQLKDLAMRAKCAVVLSTHDERIFDVANRRLHIEDGRCFEVPIHYH
ncbi:MAG: ABC transporter ATP-binding protein [Alphaproteobacteria bacterium]|nr:ABC transporter ATP-binding protein [Alphaproteobacteria bacterium]